MPTSRLAVAVFCGSRAGRDPRHAQSARALGRGLAEAGMRLVYGGGNVGLMGILADATLAAGGEVTGVIPGGLFSREVAHKGLTELRLVAGLAERKQVMHDLADAFVALGGGIGTLDELIEMMTWRQLGLHAKPTLVVDLDGFWRPFLAALRHAEAAGFGDRLAGLVEAVPDVPACLARLSQVSRP